MATKMYENDYLANILAIPKSWYWALPKPGLGV